MGYRNWKEENQGVNKTKINYIISVIIFSTVVWLALPVDIQRVTAEEDAAIEIEENVESEESEEPVAVTVPVPIYNYDIANIVVPTSYAVALNPYELPIKTNSEAVSTAQVVSQNYGIVNKSTRDKIVTATLKIEDENAGKIVFVDSKDEALKADKDTYAVYLAVVPADSSGIKIDGSDADKDTSAEALTNVAMSKSENNAVILHEGDNFISFKLSKAIYGFDGSEGITLEASDNEDTEKIPELAGLAADNMGATAFTFDGVMNPKADWTKLSKGVKISVMYNYENATGDETIADGTGAMLTK